jgi:hypothetical protein
MSILCLRKYPRQLSDCPGKEVEEEEEEEEEESWYW